MESVSGYESVFRICGQENFHVSFLFQILDNIENFLSMKQVEKYLYIK